MLGVLFDKRMELVSEMVTRGDFEADTAYPDSLFDDAANGSKAFVLKDVDGGNTNINSIWVDWTDWNGNLNPD